MPTKKPSGLSDSWTDDLQGCPYTGIGNSTNVIYRHNGQPSQEHHMENTAIRFKCDGDIWLYGVFDGHDQNTVADYASQKMSAELLLGQLQSDLNDQEIKQLLSQAFASVERDYFTNIGDKLAHRSELLMRIPENIYEAHQQYPDVMAELDRLQRQISSGASAVVALINRGRLFVANVGDCRALDCRIGSDGQISVTELNVRHDLDNADEMVRLAKLGLSESEVAHLNHTTRCLGDFPRKGGYKDIDFLKAATSEPVIAEADVVGGIPLDQSCRFLILTTASVCKAFEDATGSTNVNRDLAALAFKEFSMQSTINGVAQAVVDEIARRHYDAFVGDAAGGGLAGDRSFICQKREDMTLLIRNFNQPLAPPSSSSTPSFASFISGPIAGRTITPEISLTRPSAATTTRLEDTWDATTLGNTASSGWSRDESPPQVYSLPVDENGRVAPYVDFGEFYEGVRKYELEAKLVKKQSGDGENRRSVDS